MTLSKNLKEVRRSSGVSEGENIPGRGDSCHKSPEMRVLTSSRNKKGINVAEAVSAFSVCACKLVMIQGLLKTLAFILS